MTALVSVDRRAAIKSAHPLVWYAVAAIVLFALAAVALTAAIIWCDMHHQMFGAFFRTSTWEFKVGCV